MKRFTLTVALVLTATGALAQPTPGDDFLGTWDLDRDGTATLAELREMRGDVFGMFDTNDDEILDAEEYVTFDKARAHDIDEFTPDQQVQFRFITDGMGLAVSDADGDGQVSRQEFLDGTDAWFTALDADGDGGVTMKDFELTK